MQDKKDQTVKKELILREKLAIQRTYLANQTTFLSFLRTSMYFLVAGFTIQKLAEHPQARFFETLLFVISGVLLITGIINYFRNHKRINQSKVHIGNYKENYEDPALK